MAKQNTAQATEGTEEKNTQKQPVYMTEEKNVISSAVIEVDRSLDAITEGKTEISRRVRGKFANGNKFEGRESKTIEIAETLTAMSDKVGFPISEAFNSLADIHKGHTAVKLCNKIKADARKDWKAEQNKPKTE